MELQVTSNNNQYSSLNDSNEIDQQLVRMDAFDSYDSIREELVNIAISFLLNPKIQSSSLLQKRQFLASKGLTSQEIDAAIDRFFNHLSQNTNGFQSFSLQTTQHHHPPPQATLPLAFWPLTRAIAPPVITIGVICFGLHWFYINYIRPALYGPTSKATDEIKNQIAHLSDQLLKLQRDIARIEFSLKSNFDSDYHANNSMIESSAISELKNEISAIKAMMLGKNQFPTTPASATSIPSWQLPSSKETNSSNLGSSSDCEQNKSAGPSPSPEAHSDSTCKSDSTFEMVPGDSNSNGEPSSSSTLMQTIDDNNSLEAEELDNQVETNPTKANKSNKSTLNKNRFKNK